MRLFTSLARFSLSALFLITLYPVSIHAEKIKEFHSTVTLSQNDSVVIEEQIVYDSEGQIKHGIYRDIPLSTVKGNPVNRHKVQIISIADENGNSVPYSTITEYSSGQTITRFKIGNENSTFSGIKKYVIRYRFTHFLSRDAGITSLYLNITGNAWPFPIEKSSFTIMGSNGVPMFSADTLECFTGNFGENKECGLVVTEKNQNVYSASFQKVLFPGQGITIRLPLTYTSSPFPSPLFAFLLNYWDAFFFIFCSFAVIACTLFLYRKYGKDPDQGRVIVPEYEAPVGVTLLEAAYILGENVVPQAVSAQLVELAREGFLTIEAKEGSGIFGMLKSLTFSLLVNKIPEDEASKILLGFLSRDIKDDFTALVGNIKAKQISYNEIPSAEEFLSKPTLTVGKSISLSKAKFTSNEFTNLVKVVESSLLEKNIFDRIFFHEMLGKQGLVQFNSSTSILKVIKYVLLFIVILPSLFSFLWVRSELSVSMQYPIIFSVISIISIIALFRSLNRKTEKGVDLKYKLLGLKKYIDVAEEERIAFHNVPSKTPELFTKLLPWAMLFGLEKKWSKEFESIAMKESDASFYHSSVPLSSAVFASSLGASMASFGTVAAQAASVASSSGGGGGSSGGGGGGGGGGSW